MKVGINTAWRRVRCSQPLIQLSVKHKGRFSVKHKGRFSVFYKAELTAGRTAQRTVPLYICGFDQTALRIQAAICAALFNAAIVEISKAASHNQFP